MQNVAAEKKKYMPLSKKERAIRARRSRHNSHIKKTYGISIDDYDKIFKAQKGKCAICKGGTSKNFLAVDHNHKNNNVRGLLCARCNSALARFMDRIENVRSAARYLKDDGAKVKGILNDAE